MKAKSILVWSLGLGLGALTCLAAEPASVESLQQQLQQMQENFNRVVRDQQAQIEALKKQLDEVKQSQTAAVAAAPPPQSSVAATPTSPVATAKPWSPTDPIRLGGRSAYADLGLVATFAAGASTAKDIEGGTQLGGHDPNQRGFTVQGVELNLQGAIDPHFRGSANILFSLDSGGETFVELEEAWLETMALPGNLQVRAGQLMTDFGRINTKHPHAWGFVDSPLVTARFLGSDGLRNPGARLSWLAPLPFYSELMLTAQNSHGENAASFRSGGHSHGGEESEEDLPIGFRHPDNDRGVRGIGDLLFVPRWVSSFDLTDSQTLVVGVSAAFGPNSSGQSGGTRTEMYGADVYWKWKSPRHHRGFPFVSFQSEAMTRQYDLGAFDWDEDGNLGDADGNGFPDEGVLVDATGVTPAMLGKEKVTDYGFYSEMLYGFRPGWVAGMRFDYVTGDRGGYEKAGLMLADNSGSGTAAGRDHLRNTRWRLSPNLTWFPSEFSKLRLQYNYDDRRDIGTDHSVWLQFEFLLGAHAAHKF